VTGHLARPAGSFAHVAPPVGDEVIELDQLDSYIRLAQANGTIQRESIREDLMRLHTLLWIQKWHIARMQADPMLAIAGGGSMAKLRNSDITRLAAHVSCRILGAHATVVGPDAMSGGAVQAATVLSPAPAIYGGTDQVQRNIIGERVLGLSKDPGPPKETPFRELLVSANARG
jgi:alkylation response protein AidB-like acyl-CoA dehydrogenase